METRDYEETTKPSRFSLRLFNYYDGDLCLARRKVQRRSRPTNFARREVRLLAKLLFPPAHSPAIPHPARPWTNIQSVEEEVSSCGEVFAKFRRALRARPDPHSLPPFVGHTTSNKGLLLACCTIIPPKKTSNGRRGKRIPFPPSLTLVLFLVLSLSCEHLPFTSVISPRVKSHELFRPVSRRSRKRKFMPDETTSRHLPSRFYHRDAENSFRRHHDRNVVFTLFPSSGSSK